jgi:sucrose-6-phosphate hydrolase SacC (GH32 family)
MKMNRNLKCVLVLASVVAFLSLVSARALDASDDSPSGAAALYREALRPQFHFTAAKNWLNDPNGLVFYKGEYHLFFQHNPKGIEWGDMTWGHAVSTDMLHWKQLENALEPDNLGAMWSGSAVVDSNNTTGFQTGDEKPIVCIYTSAGGKSPQSKGKPFTQSIAYSLDRGRTWTKFEKNPVLAHVAGENRDPKVVWHAPTKRWIMALYLDGDKYGLFTSPNLKQWEKLCDIPPFKASECPDFFELPISADTVNGRGIKSPSPSTGKGRGEGAAQPQTSHSKLIFWGGNGNYLIGSFDGKQFKKESGPHRFEYGSNFYAAQTYSDIPATDGRRIQIAWMSGGRYPNMPFNQQMTVPAELTLRETHDGLRLFRSPVRELESLRTNHHSMDAGPAEGGNPLAEVAGDLFDIVAEIKPGTAKRVTMTIRGTPLVFDAERKELKLLDKTAPLEPIDGKIRLRVLVDRASIEVFGNDGLITMSSCFVPPDNAKSPPLSLKGDGAEVGSLDVWNLKSCWNTNPKH